MRARSLALVMPFVLLAVSAPGAARADVDFDDDQPRAFSIQPRPFRLGHEFELGLGVLPLDAFYVGAVLGFSYTYHFTDFWAWEIVALDYSFNIDTSLQDRLERDFNLQPDQIPARITLFGATSLVIKPMFGKLAWRNRSLVYGETYFSLGLGPHLLVRPATVDRGASSDWVPTLRLGLGFRFWRSEVFSVRFAVQEHLIFTRLVPESSLLIMLSGAFNFARGAAP